MSTYEAINYLAIGFALGVSVTLGVWLSHTLITAA